MDLVPRAGKGVTRRTGVAPVSIFTHGFFNVRDRRDAVSYGISPPLREVCSSAFVAAVYDRRLAAIFKHRRRSQTAATGYMPRSLIDCHDEGGALVPRGVESKSL